MHARCPNHVHHPRRRGMFWWEPLMAGRGYFDHDGEVLPIIHAFEKYTRPMRRPDGQSRRQ